MNNALNEILHGPEAIPESEFEPRVGFTRSSAQALLARVGALLDSHR